MLRLHNLLLCCLCAVGLNAQQENDLSAYLQNGAYRTYLEKSIAKSKTYDDDNIALELLEVAIGETSSKLEADTLLAEAYHRLGIHHYYLDQEPKAILAWEKAIQIRDSFFPAYHLKIIKGYRNIGNAYVALENLGEAESSLQKALDLNLENPKTDTVLLADLYRELAYIFSQQDDVKQAEIYLEIAEDLCENVYATDPWELAQIYDYRYLHEKRQNNPLKMIEYAQKSLRAFESIEDKYEEDHWGIADSYNNLAIAYEMLENSMAAKKHYQKALSINRSYEIARIEETAKNYANLIGIYRKEKLYEQAEKNANEAIVLIENLNKSSLYSLILHNQAEIYADQKQYERAIKGYHRAIKLLVPGFESDNIFENPNTDFVVIGDKPNLILSLQEKALTLLQIGHQDDSKPHLQAAVTTYDTIAKYIDQVRLDFESDESKSFLTQQAKPIFEKAIQANLDLYALSQDVAHVENAFNFVERSKAVILLDAIKENQAKINANIPEDLLAREHQLREALQDIEQSLLESEEKEALRGELVLTNRKLELLVDTLERQFPSYHALKYSTKLISLADVQTKLLRSNQAMIQYFVGEEELYIFYILPSGVPSVYEVPLDFPLAEWIEKFRIGIYGKLNTQNGDSLDEDYVLYAWRLYKKLLLPIVEEQPLSEQLLIVPDGILGYIPFDALLTEEVPSADFTQYYSHPYLIRQHQLSYTYSATLLQTMNEAVIAPKYYQVLAFAPRFGRSTAASASDRGSIVDARSGLSPLLHNKREAAAINDMLGGELIHGTEATRQGFLNVAAQYAYLHLSSHARMNDEYPDYSYIAFTQASNDRLDEEELLFVGELYNTPLNAEMVVLSACETGLGKLNKGEGIISLARAFSYAGARSVITTLWRVNDQETANLMIDFYEQLQAGKTKDEALCLAKRRFLDEGINPHPYYWAGFTPIGNMNSIETGGMKWWWFALCLFGVLVIGYFYNRMKVV